MNIGIVIQIENRIVYINPFLIKLLGSNSISEFIGRNLLDLIHSKDRKLLSEMIDKGKFDFSNKSNDPKIIEDLTVTLDGTEIITELSAFVLNYYGKTGLMVMLHDVTERTKAKLSLIDALKRAEESDKLKSAFLQNISHEIRTPLNGIIGFTSILANEELEREEIQEIVPVIKKSSDRLIQMVNNILEISKIETGQIVVTRKEFPFSKLIDEVTNLYNMEITAKDIEFINKIPKEINELVINSDYSKLFQIFSNLVNNAAKFTNEGTIEIGIELKEHLLILFVKDTGVGISNDKKSKIFDRFVQADTSISRGYEGAGIGLAISKGLIHSLGGEIWFDSEYGKGSTFFISIPVSDFVNGSKVFDTPKDTGSISNIKNGKILIAEDDLASFLYLKKILKTAGFEILHAENGITAIDLVMENNDIILILMDMKMPLMDGFEATRQIKKINPDITVIAQTAYVFDEEKARILQSGCEDYIAKPINKNDLMRMLNKYLK